MSFLSLPLERSNSPRASRSIARILESAAALFGRAGYQGASMESVARGAGVSKSLLHYHFRSKDQLLIAAQRATFRQLHQRFEDRFERGEHGLETALEGIDALWEAVLDMQAHHPFIVETMSLAGQDKPIRRHVDDFLREAMDLLEKGIRNVFSQDLGKMSVPPKRLAMLIRTSLHGLVVELSYARTPSERARVDQAYTDLRGLFARVILTGPLESTRESP